MMEIKSAAGVCGVVGFLSAILLDVVLAVTSKVPISNHELSLSNDCLA